MTNNGPKVDISSPKNDMKSSYDANLEPLEPRVIPNNEIILEAPQSNLKPSNELNLESPKQEILAIDSTTLEAPESKMLPQNETNLEPPESDIKASDSTNIEAVEVKIKAEDEHQNEALAYDIKAVQNYNLVSISKKQAKFKPSDRVFFLKHGMDVSDIKPRSVKARIDAPKSGLRAGRIVIDDPVDARQLLATISRMIRASQSWNTEIKNNPKLEGMLIDRLLEQEGVDLRAAALEEKQKLLYPRQSHKMRALKANKKPTKEHEAQAIEPDIKPEDNPFETKALDLYAKPTKEYKLDPMKVNEKKLKDRHAFNTDAMLITGSTYSLAGLMKSMEKTLGISSGSFSLSEFMNSGAPFVDPPPTAHPHSFLSPKVTKLKATNEIGIESLPLPKMISESSEEIEETEELEENTSDYNIEPPSDVNKKPTQEHNKNPIITFKKNEPPQWDEKAFDVFKNDVPEFIIPEPVVKHAFVERFDPRKWTIKEDSEADNISVHGLMLGTKEKWDSKPPTKLMSQRNAKYRSKAIQALHERGPDFMSNAFDVYFFETRMVNSNGGLETKELPFFREDDSMYMTTRAVGVRTASIEIPLPKTTVYETPFLTSKVAHNASKIEQKYRSSLSIDLDEPCYIIDMVNDQIQSGIVQSGFGNFYKSFTPMSRGRWWGYDPRNRIRLDIIIGHVSLMRDYGKKPCEEFGIENETKQKLEPWELPMWVFEDAVFLGFEGDIKFERDSANQAQVSLPFVFKRVYLVDMIGEENASNYTFGHKTDTRNSLDLPLKE